MTVLGISGHQRIPTMLQSYIYDELKYLIRQYDNFLEGVSSLAAGADQLFATVVLSHGGMLRVILPCLSYEETITEDNFNVYRSLLEQAASVEILPNERPSEEAFFQAGKRVVDLADVLIAVWDGEPSRGVGGTADVVQYAIDRGVPVRRIWRAGVKR